MKRFHRLSSQTHCRPTSAALPEFLIYPAVAFAWIESPASILLPKIQSRVVQMERNFLRRCHCSKAKPKEDNTKDHFSSVSPYLRGENSFFHFFHAKRAGKNRMANQTSKLGPADNRNSPIEINVSTTVL